MMFLEWLLYGELALWGFVLWSILDMQDLLRKSSEPEGEREIYFRSNQNRWINTVAIIGLLSSAGYLFIIWVAYTKQPVSVEKVGFAYGLAGAEIILTLYVLRRTLFATRYLRDNLPPPKTGTGATF